MANLWIWNWNRANLTWKNTMTTNAAMNPNRFNIWNNTIFLNVFWRDNQKADSVIGDKSFFKVTLRLWSVKYYGALFDITRLVRFWGARGRRCALSESSRSTELLCFWSSFVRCFVGVAAWRRHRRQTEAFFVRFANSSSSTTTHFGGKYPTFRPRRRMNHNFLFGKMKQLEQIEEDAQWIAPPVAHAREWQSPRRRGGLLILFPGNPTDRPTDGRANFCNEWN